MSEQGKLNDYTIAITNINTISGQNPYGSATATDLQALFNQRVTALLISPDTYTNATGYDDNATSYTINTKGWNINIDYTAEGSFGFTPIDHLTLPRKDSNFTHNRMYYSYGYEPYYQLIFKREQDQYFNSITLKWDANNLLGYFNLRSLDNVYNYAIYFQISRSNYNLIDLLYRNTTVWNSGPDVLVGYKHYNRTITAWAPTRFGVISGLGGAIDNTYIKQITDLSFSIQSIKYPNPHTDELNTYKIYYKDVIFKNNTPIYILPYNGSNTFTPNMSKHIDSTCYNYCYSFFVEGREDDVFVEVKCESNNSVKYTTILKNNEIYNATDSIESNYIIKLIGDPNNYFKIIKPDEEMIKGSITGTITLKSCQVNTENLYVICLRSDGIKIGEYPVSSTNTYRIHNLNVNERYHIILVDKARTLEWMVSSYRKPMPYDEIIEIVPPAVNGYIIADGILKLLKWDFIEDQVEDDNIKYAIEYCNIYFSNQINNNNLVKTGNVIKVNGKSLDLLNSYLNDYKYYMIETVYKNKTKQSTIITNDTISNIAKFSSEYND